MKSHLKQFFFLLTILLAACSAGNEPEISPAAEISPAKLSTSTPVPTATNNPTPTATRVTRILRPSPSLTPTLPENIAKLSEMLTDCGYHIEYSPNQTWAAGYYCGYDETRIVNVEQTKKWIFSYGEYYGKKANSADGVIEPVFWSLDGKYLYLSIGRGGSGPIYFGYSWGLLRLDLENGNIIELLPVRFESGFYDFSFSPDGNYLAYILQAAEPMVLNIVDLRTGEHVNFGILNKYNQAGNTLWSPDQRMIVFEQAIIDLSGDDQHLFSAIAVNLATGSRQVLVLDSPVQMSPDRWIDDNKMALNCEDGIWRIFDFEENVLYEK